MNLSDPTRPESEGTSRSGLSVEERRALAEATKLEAEAAAARLWWVKWLAAVGAVCLSLSFTQCTISKEYSAIRDLRTERTELRTALMADSLEARRFWLEQKEAEVDQLQHEVSSAVSDLRIATMSFVNVDFDTVRIYGSRTSDLARDLHAYFAQMEVPGRFDVELLDGPGPDFWLGWGSQQLYPEPKVLVWTPAGRVAPAGSLLQLVLRRDLDLPLGSISVSQGDVSERCLVFVVR